MAHILVVDDAPELRRMYRRVLEKSGHTIDEAPDGVPGLSKIMETCIDVVVSDLDMPIMSGDVMIREAQRQLTASDRRHPIFIMITGEQTLPELTNVTVLSKPIETAALINAVETALRTRS